jgi:hypothetical protein
VVAVHLEVEDGVAVMEYKVNNKRKKQLKKLAIVSRVAR